MDMLFCGGGLPWFIIPSVFLMTNTPLLVTALRWSATPINGEVVYPCAGRDLRLDWDYSLDSGDVVTSTEWTFHGRSQEMLAVLVHGHFLPTATFSHRVTLMGQAGILLSQVTPADSGSYTVEVTGHDVSGASFAVNRTIVVQVADSLMTDDHELHAHVEPAAHRDPATDQFAISLACGHFTYAGNPPVDVEWTTPEGQTLNSTSYEKGYFKLRLPNPISGGGIYLYTCSISPSTLNVSCLHGDSAEAIVYVDAILARLTLLEAEQNYLRAETSQKDGVISQLSSGLHSVQSNVSSLASCCDDDYIPPGTVRLVNGSNAMEGRVEIRVGDSWGTICDDDWDNDDAKVVCNMLGYFASGARAMPQAHFGQGSGRIVLDEVNCTGIEQSLQTCAANPFGMSDCTHQEDAGVICAGH